MRANSPEIITRPPQVRQVVQAAVDVRRSWTNKTSLKMIKTSATRLGLSDLEAMHDADENDGELKVVERVASISSSCSSISPHKKMGTASSTDRVLTFLQNARVQNIPVRSGKWNPEEEEYLRKLVELFCLGVLDDVEQKSSMRAWLSKMLNCCPMRISKKQMNGEKFIGKAKFKKNIELIQQMTQEHYDEACDEVHRLRSSFLKHWAKDEFAKRTTRDKPTSFEEWYSKVLNIVPKPKIAKHSRLVDTRRRPEPMALGNLREQIQAEQKQGRRCLSATPAVRKSARTHKRPRLEMDTELPNEHASFLDLVPNNVNLEGLALTLSLESPSAYCHQDQNDEDDWILDICAEPEPPLTQTHGYGRVDCSVHDAGSAQFSTTTIEDEFHCKEILTPQHTTEVEFDFDLSSKLTHEEMQDLPSYGSSLWEDDLLVEGFALLSDPGLLTWEENEYPVVNCSHSVLTSSISTFHF